MPSLMFFLHFRAIPVRTRRSLEFHFHLFSPLPEFLQDASSDFKAISSSSRVRVHENGSLIIHNTQKSDAGKTASASKGRLGVQIA